MQSLAIQPFHESPNLPMQTNNRQLQMPMGQQSFPMQRFTGHRGLYTQTARQPQSQPLELQEFSTMQINGQDDIQPPQELLFAPVRPTQMYGDVAGFQPNSLGTQVYVSALPDASYLPLSGSTALSHTATNPSHQLTSHISQPVALYATPASADTQAGKRQVTKRRSRVGSTTRAGVARWTPEDLRRAQQMSLSGSTVKEFAEALQRTENSVNAKIWRAKGNDAHQSDKKHRRGSCTAQPATGSDHND